MPLPPLPPQPLQPLPAAVPPPFVLATRATVGLAPGALAAFLNAEAARLLRASRAASQVA